MENFTSVQGYYDHYTGNYMENRKKNPFSVLPSPSACCRYFVWGPRI